MSNSTAVHSEGERLDRGLDVELHRSGVAGVRVAFLAVGELAEPVCDFKSQYRRKGGEKQNALSIAELVLGLGGRLGDALQGGKELSTWRREGREGENRTCVLTASIASSQASLVLPTLTSSGFTRSSLLQRWVRSLSSFAEGRARFPGESLQPRPTKARFWPSTTQGS